MARKSLDKKIYDIEIEPGDQKPPWDGIECVEKPGLPKGWKCKKENNIGEIISKKQN